MCKRVLIGNKGFNPDWSPAIRNLYGKTRHIVVRDLSLITKEDIEQLQINYIIPLCDEDYQNIYHLGDIVLYPKENVKELLNNKVLFSGFMTTHFPQLIPETYTPLDIQNMKFPVIFKPAYSVSGQGMKIYRNKGILKTNININMNNGIWQEYITDNYEYSAYLTCIYGEIVKHKILKQSYPLYHIKHKNFDKNAKVVINDNIIFIFSEIIQMLDY